MTNPLYAEYIRTLIRDDLTYQDPTYYGAKFDFRKDHGTAHISVLAQNGDAVSATSSVNTM